MQANLRHIILGCNGFRIIVTEGLYHWFTSVHQTNVNTHNSFLTGGNFHQLGLSPNKGFWTCSTQFPIWCFYSGSRLLGAVWRGCHTLDNFFKRLQAFRSSLFSGNCTNRMAILRPTLTLWCVIRGSGVWKQVFLFNQVCVYFPRLNLYGNVGGGGIWTLTVRCSSVDLWPQ